MSFQYQSETDATGKVLTSSTNTDLSEVTALLTAIRGDDEDCDLSACRPRCCQIFAKPVYFLMMLNIYCVVEGTISSGVR